MHLTGSSSLRNVSNRFSIGHFQFARYIDTLLQSRIMALQGRLSTQDVGTDDEKQRSQTISRDRSCMRFVGLIVKHFADSVILDVKHVDQALPRLLSLWFEFTGIKVESVTARHGGTLRREAEQLACESLKRECKLWLRSHVDLCLLILTRAFFPFQHFFYRVKTM